MKNTVITSVTVNGKPTDLHGNPITKDLNVYTEGIFEKSQILNLTGKPRRYFPIQGRIEDGRPDLTARRLAFKLAFGRVATSDAVLLDEDIEPHEGRLWFGTDVYVNPEEFAPITDLDNHYVYQYD